MNKMIYLWNRLYYGLFFYYSRIQIFLYKMLRIIPICILCKLGILNKKHKKLDTGVIKDLTDESFSIVLLVSDTTILALSALIVWTVVNLISSLIPSISLVLLNRVTFILITSILILSVNYFVLWRKGKYIEYFKEFHNSSSSRNWIWSIISIITLIFALLLFILSFHVM